MKRLTFLTAAVYERKDIKISCTPIIYIYINVYIIITFSHNFCTNNNNIIVGVNYIALFPLEMYKPPRLV